MSDKRVAELAAKIVFSYLDGHKVTTAEVAKLCASVVDTLAALDVAGVQPAQLSGGVDMSISDFLAQPPARPRPKKQGRPPNSETTPCLHCNRRFRDVEKHVWEAHGMDAERYRSWFSLPSSAPTRPWEAASA